MRRPASWGRRLLAVVFWAGFGAFVWGRPVGVFTYTAVVVVASILVAVLVGLPETTLPSERSRHGEVMAWRAAMAGEATTADSREHGRTGRLLVVAAGLTVAAASVVLWSRADTVAVGQSVSPTAGPLMAALALCVGLGGLVFRWFGWRAAVVGVAVVGYSSLVGSGVDSGELLMAVVFSTDGVYGPFAQAATTWLALVCLFVGCWRAGSGAELLRSRINSMLTSGGLPAGNRTAVAGLLGVTGAGDDATGRTGLSRWAASRLRALFPPSMGLAAFLVAWLVTDTAYLPVVAAGVLPAVLVGSTLLLTGYLAEQSSEPTTQQPPVSTAQSAAQSATEPGQHRLGRWLSLGLFVGAPVLVGWLLLRSTTLTTALLIGSGCVAVGQVCVQSGRCWLAGNRLRVGLRQGVHAVGTGCLWAVRRLAVLCVLLGVLGGIAEVARITGVLATVSSTIFTLSAGQTSIRLALALGLAVGFGWLLSGLGGYVAGVIVCVPLIVSIPPLAGVTAHFSVLYAAVLGSALPIPHRLPAITNQTGSLRNRFERWIRYHGPTLAVLAPVSLLPVAVVAEPRLLTPTTELATLWAILPVWCGMVILAVTAQRLAGRHDADSVGGDPSAIPNRLHTPNVIRGVVLTGAGCIGVLAPVAVVQYLAVAIGFVGLAVPLETGA